MEKNKNRERRVISIRAKFLLLLLPMMVISITVVTVLGINSIERSTQNALRQSMEQTVEIAADRVADFVSDKKELTIAIASRIGALYENQITSPYDKAKAIAFEQRIKDMNDSYGFTEMYVVDNDGYERTETRDNIASYDFKFYNAITKDGAKSYMTEPEQDPDSPDESQYMIRFAAPIYNANDDRIGVLVCKMDAIRICDLVRQISVGKEGSTFAMDNYGRCIAHKDLSMLYGGERFNMAYNNPDFASLNELWTDMRDNTSGYRTYDYNGNRLAAFTTIRGTDNWTLAVTASEKEFMADANRAIIKSIIVAAIVGLICSVAVIILLNKITERVEAITKRLESLSQGNLTYDDTNEVVTTDEIGRLSKAAKRLAIELHQIIDSIENSLGDIAEGNLTSSRLVKLPGDLSHINAAIDINRRKLSEIMKSINRTAEEVARGSSQMASSAAGLAQGASEQSSSVEELFATVTDLTEKANAIGGAELNNTLDNDEDDNLTDEQAEEKIGSAKSVSEMLRIAMERINETSGAIRKITMDIDSISSETGMLALNASVEATHAGEYGRGFAVIASEVRTLSEKSREAAKIADKKTESINRAVERGNQTVDFAINSVSEMTVIIGQIKSALEQISNVIENTAATAEETAASSEELSAQADLLKDLVAGFVFDEEENKVEGM